MSVELDNSDETDSGPFVEFGPSPTVTYTYSQPAPTVPVGSGPVPNATFRSFPISDKVSLQVNVGSGDALLTTSDLSIPEEGSNLNLGTSYNSLLTPSSVAQGSNGYGWRQAEGVDVRLYLGSGSSGSVTFLGEDGTAGAFTAPASGSNTYGSPPVFHVTLTNAPTSTCSGSTYQMTWHATGEVMCFNADGLLTSETDRNGNTTAYSYNGDGQETSVTYTPDGNSSPLYTVGASYTGNYLTGLSESGGSTGTKNITYNVDSSGDLTSIAQADGTTITLGYDSSHDLTSVENGAGVTTTLGYNSSHQVTSVTQPYSSCGCTGTTRLSYVSSTETQEADPNTNQSDVVSAVPNTTYTINSQDLVTKAVDPAGNTRSASYNSVNDVTSAANGLSGGTTNNTYTNGGESVTASESPTGATSSLAYSNTNSGTNPTAEYQPSSEKDAQGNTTAFTYNGAGNELTAASALPATSKVTYNSDGTPETSTDPDNGETTYSYDSSHQLTTITPPTSGSLKPTTITYDGFGRVATVTDGDGNTVTYTYDLSDRILKAAYTGGSHTLTVTYAYDGAGNLKTQTDPSGTTSYTYNGLNETATKTATSGGGTLTYTYDADGNMTSAQDAGGTTTYTYNDLNQLSSLTDEAGMLWEFAYNQAGERINTWFNTNSSESSWAGKITTTYDASGRLTRIQAYNDETPSNVVSDTSYCYNTAISGTTCGSSTADDTSLVQYSVNNQTSTVSQYSYDDSNRLTKVTNDNGTTYSYGYDNDGDVTSGAGVGSLTYDTSNQITTSGYGYDGAGNLISDPSNGTLTYNDAGQLISASNAGGSGNGGGSESFSYAGANQDEPLSDGSATSIVYGLAGQDGQPSVDSYSTGGGTDYIIRDQQGDPLGMVRGGDSYMFVTDNVGSVTGIVEYCGCTAATYGYSPYGMLAAKGAALGGSLVNENLIGYTGSLTDDMTVGSTGYVHDGNRWYASATGAFTTEDANSYLGNPSDGNRYAYASDSPVNYVDPSGQSVYSCFEAVGLGIAGGLFGVVTGLIGIATAATGVGLAVAAVGYSIASASLVFGINDVANNDACG
jgi:RHS repeat-associated protein